MSLTRALTRAATKIKTVDSFRRLRLRDFIQLASYSHPDTAKILVGYRPPFSVSAFTVAKSSRVIRAKNLLRIPKASEAFAQNQNANAIRWGTLYNFRFDADQPPDFGSA